MPSVRTKTLGAVVLLMAGLALRAAAGPVEGKTFLSESWANGAESSSRGPRPAIKAWIPTDGHVSGLALAPGAKRVFASYWEDENNSRVQEFDIPSGSLARTLEFGSKHTHGGVALSKDGRYLYTSNYYYTYISRMDLAFGRKADLDVGGVRTAVWAGTLDITPDGRKLIVQLGRDGREYDMHNDQLSLVDVAGGAFRLVAQIKLEDEPVGHRPAISPDSRYVYIPTLPRRSESARLYEVSLSPPYKVTRSVLIQSRKLYGTAFSPRGKKVYVGDIENRKILAVDLASFRVVGSLDFDGEPGTMAVGPDGASLWVLDTANRAVRILDISKGPPRLIGSVPDLREDPSDIVFSPETDAAYISHSGDSGGIAELKLHAAPAPGSGSSVLGAPQTQGGVSRSQSGSEILAPPRPQGGVALPAEGSSRPRALGADRPAPGAAVPMAAPARPPERVPDRSETAPGQGRPDLRGYALVGGAALLAVALTVPLVLLKRRHGAEAAMSRISAAMRSGAAPHSPELHRMFQEYRAAGGDLGRFDAAELACVVPEAELAAVASRISVPKALQLAAQLAGRGEPAKGAACLSDHVVAGAPGTPGGEDAVVAVFEKAGSLQRLLDRFGRAGQPPALYSSYACALLRRGKPQEAWSVISNKPMPNLTPEDTLLIFNLNVQLGRPEQARVMLRRVDEIKPLRGDLSFYYGLAQMAERSPAGLRLAMDIYGRFVECGVAYQDSQARYSRLRALVPRTSTPPREPRAVESPPASAPPRAAPPGAAGGLVGGKYELGRELGQGGMGVVLAAVDRGLGRPVAIKKMRSEYRSLPRERERFLAEARTIAHLTHPYIVGIHEIVEDAGDIYLVFDYVDGQPLSQLLAARKRLPLGECRRIFNHVCQAVDAAHRCGVLHRDLKPANIMLDSNGFAKVLDFGLAREAKDSISRLTHQDVSGTPAYMAPEQHLGQTHRASDVFALGVTLYEMLTGELPFQGPDFLAQKERAKYTPPNFLAAGLSKGIEPLMAGVLEPDYRKRVKDALDLLEALQKL